MKYYFSLLIIVLLASCSASYNVFHDTNPEADFSAVKTYQLVYAGQKEMRNALAKRTIESSIHELMANRGYQKVDEEASIILAYDGRVRQKKQVSVDSNPVMYGPRWGYYGWDSYEYREYDITQGTLVIDFVAPQSNKLMWQGGVTSNIDPTGAKSDELKKAVRLIFQKFPYEAGSGQRISAARAKSLSAYKE